MKQQHKMQMMKDMTRKIQCESRMGSIKNWRMTRWCNWLCEMKKKDEEKRMELEHQKLVSSMIKSAEGGTGLLHNITKPTAGRGGVQILKEEEEDAKPFARCEEKRKEWAKHWQCDTKVRDLKDMPWICSRAGGPLRLFLRSFVGGRLCERQRC